MKWLLLIILTPSLFAAETTGVQVQGSCDIKVIPDRGSVSFSAENQSKDQQDAVIKTNKQINSLKERIQKLKLGEIELKTTQYNVFPVREWEKDHYVNKGTKASMTLEVTTSEIQRLGDAMVEASKDRFQNVGSMSTFLSLEKSQSEYLKCLDVASNDARKKAERLAKKLGFEIGDVINVIESPVQASPSPVYAQRTMMAKGMMDTVQVDPGTQKFSTTIQVTFSIK